MTQPMHLTINETADRLRLVKGTLANWRVQGKGPRFLKMGKRVLYPLLEIEAFEQRQLRFNTVKGICD